MTSIGIISIGFHSEYWSFDDMMERFFENTEDSHGRSTVPYVMEGFVVALFGIPTAILGILASYHKNIEKIKQLHSYFTILVRVLP